ncbi:unnamed protein product [Cuscuta campestris]|uniref:CCHC-type domain-containing protein n=1 Tax=Cuscuta campestris TaxID=132261 RepID=A0A484N7Y5_9ASTE|nr:unnamed protein product [Cuscuta campestris]
MHDTQAYVPSTEWLEAQLAFKVSMVHGILQFTPSSSSSGDSLSELNLFVWLSSVRELKVLHQSLPLCGLLFRCFTTLVLLDFFVCKKGTKKHKQSITKFVFDGTPVSEARLWSNSETSTSGATAAKTGAVSTALEEGNDQMGSNKHTPITSTPSKTVLRERKLRNGKTMVLQEAADDPGPNHDAEPIGQKTCFEDNIGKAVDSGMERHDDDLDKPRDSPSILPEPPSKELPSSSGHNRDPSEGFPLKKVEVGDVVSIPAEGVSNLEEEWGFCLVGCLTGRFPGIKAIEGLISSWHLECKLHPHEKGWVIFQFLSDEDRRKVLHNGSVGTPIRTDRGTKNKGRLSYCRMLIRVDMSKELPTSFVVSLPDGEEFTQKVVYEGLPNYCYHCKKFGHNQLSCRVLRALNHRKSGNYFDKRDRNTFGKADLVRKGADSALGTPAPAKSRRRRRRAKRKLVRGPKALGSHAMPTPTALPSPKDTMKTARTEDNGVEHAAKTVNHDGQGDVCSSTTSPKDSLDPSGATKSTDKATKKVAQTDAKVLGDGAPASNQKLQQPKEKKSLSGKQPGTVGDDDQLVGTSSTPAHVEQAVQANSKVGASIIEKGNKPTGAAKKADQTTTESTPQKAPWRIKLDKQKEEWLDRLLAQAMGRVDRSDHGLPKLAPDKLRELIARSPPCLRDAYGAPRGAVPSALFIHIETSDSSLILDVFGTILELLIRLEPRNPFPGLVFGLRCCNWVKSQRLLTMWFDWHLGLVLLVVSFWAAILPAVCSAESWSIEDGSGWEKTAMLLVWGCLKVHLLGPFVSHELAFSPHTLAFDELMDMGHGISFLRVNLLILHVLRTCHCSGNNDANEPLGDLSGPWAVMGDFNAVISSTERVNCQTQSAYYMTDLRQFRINNALNDANSSRLEFTWNKGEKWAKLDRVLVNDEWENMQWDCWAEFRDMEAISDHCSVLLKLMNIQNQRTRPFKFYNMWLKHDNFDMVIRENWNQWVNGTRQYRLCVKLKKLKQPLRLLNKQHFAHISQRAESARKEYSHLMQELILEPENPSLLSRSVELRNKASFFMDAERSFFQQKTKCELLFEGDKCTKFFHALMRKKNHSSAIPFILTADQRLTTSLEEVEKEFIEYFTNLFGTTVPIEPVDWNVFEEGPLIPNHAANNLIRKVTIEEDRDVWAWIPKHGDSHFFKKLAEVRNNLAQKLGTDQYQEVDWDELLVDGEFCTAKSLFRLSMSRLGYGLGSFLGGWTLWVVETALSTYWNDLAAVSLLFLMIGYLFAKIGLLHSKASLSILNSSGVVQDLGVNELARMAKGKKKDRRPPPPTPPNKKELRNFLRDMEGVSGAGGESVECSDVVDNYLVMTEEDFHPCSKPCEVMVEDDDGSESQSPSLDEERIEQDLLKDKSDGNKGDAPVANPTNAEAPETAEPIEKENCEKEDNGKNSGNEIGKTDCNTPGNKADIPKEKKTFASLFEKNRSEDKGMKLHQVDMAEDEEVFIQPEDVTPMEELWGPCLVGCFTGRFPGLAPIQSLVESWKVPCQFVPHHKGWVIFKFLSNEDRDSVLHMDDHRINNKKLLLNIPQDGFMWNAKSFSTMPVWVKLMDVPMQFWGHNSLSKIASKLGRPLFTDGLTNKVASKLTLEEDPDDKLAYKKPNFCRVLIHMDLSKPPPSSVKVNFVGGSYMQHVEYEDLPLYCYHCEKFGHTPFDCLDLHEIQRKETTEEQIALDKARVEVMKTSLLADNDKEREKPKQNQKGKQVLEGTKGGEKLADPNEPSPSFSRKDDNDGFTLVGKGRGSLTTHPLKEANFNNGSKQPQFRRETRSSGRGHNHGNRGGTYREAKFKLFLHNKLPSWSSTDNFAMIDDGRMAVIWNPLFVTCTVLDVGDQFIHCRILCNVSQKCFHITFVFALYNVTVRRQLWETISDFAVNIKTPWAIMGDFNSVLNSSERLNCHTYAYDMTDLLHFRLNNDLIDAKATGTHFTWNKGNKWAKLDRVMVNCEWDALQWDCWAEFKPMEFQSDHCPVLLHLIQSSTKSPKPFKFFNMWLKHDSFDNTLKHVWDMRFNGTRQFRLCRKLKMLKHPLKQLNNKDFAHISSRAEEARKSYTDLMDKLYKDPDNLELLQLVANTRKKASFYSERSFIQQKVKCNFINEGDKCTKFFHAMVKKQSVLNAIPVLITSQGTTTTSLEAIVEEFIGYYNQIFGNTVPTSPVDWNVFKEGPLIQHQDAIDLVRNVDRAEVREALFSIGDDKAPGPDGYTAAFFKKKWDIVGDTVFDAVSEFFLSGRLYKQINHALVVLIPKGDPMAPTLFLFCMEYLSRLIRRMLYGSRFTFHNRCSKLGITHVTFADDVMMFCRGNVDSVNVLAKAINIFSQVSGLHVNPLKSNIFLPGEIKDSREDILALVPFPQGKLPVRYLGLPLTSQRASERDFAPLVNKVDEHIRKWNTKTLSAAGRLELIRSVIQGIEGFWFQAFPIHKSVLDRITSLCRTFLWGSKFCKVAWEDICKPKDEGGLGLNQPIIWNQALLSKNLWNIASNKETLWV